MHPDYPTAIQWDIIFCTTESPPQNRPIVIFVGILAMNEISSIQQLSIFTH